MNASLDRSFAEQQDRADGLASMRDAFRIPTRADGTEQVYLCGHSLGLQPKAVGSMSRRNWTAGRSAPSTVTSSRRARG